MLLSSIGTSASHNPIALAAAESARHGALNALVEDHDHVRDDGVDDEQNSGHFHGHNPADHAHETGSTLLDFGPIIPLIGQDEHAPPLFLANLGTSFRRNALRHDYRRMTASA